MWYRPAEQTLQAGWQVGIMCSHAHKLSTWCVCLSISLLHNTRCYIVVAVAP